MSVDVARMHCATHAHEIEQGAHVSSARGRPWRRTATRMHQRLHRARDEAVVHEEVLVHVERRVTALEIAGTVAAHAVAQSEILCAGRGPDRVSLDESKPVERTLQRGWRKQATRDGGSSNFV